MLSCIGYHMKNQLGIEHWNKINIIGYNFKFNKASKQRDSEQKF